MTNWRECDETHSHTWLSLLSVLKQWMPLTEKCIIVITLFVYLKQCSQFPARVWKLQNCCSLVNVKELLKLHTQTNQYSSLSLSQCVPNTHEAQTRANAIISTQRSTRFWTFLMWCYGKFAHFFFLTPCRLITVGTMTNISCRSAHTHCSNVELKGMRSSSI